MTTDQQQDEGALAVSALARFRAGRIQNGLESLAPAAARFGEEVTTALSGGKTTQDSLKGLAEIFVATYKTFSEAQDAAKTIGVINAQTDAALRSVMDTLRDEYKLGLDKLEEDVGRLNDHSPGAFGKFCLAAVERLQRLNSFWEQVFEEHKAKAPTMAP